MAEFPRRYSIYFADLNPTAGAELHKVRPVVVVSHNEMNQFLDTVVVCPLTTSLHPQWRSRVQVECAGREAEIAAHLGHFPAFRQGFRQPDPPVSPAVSLPARGRDSCPGWRAFDQVRG